MMEKGKFAEGSAFNRFNRLPSVDTAFEISRERIKEIADESPKVNYRRVFDRAQTLQMQSENSIARNFRLFVGKRRGALSALVAVVAAVAILFTVFALFPNDTNYTVDRAIESNIAEVFSGSFDEYSSIAVGYMDASQ